MSEIPNQADPLISVIVPWFDDNFARLKECVDSILAQQGAPAFEVMVVDNHPSPVRFAETLSHVRVLHEPTPGSYAARNCGLRHARGTIVAFTDADCRAAPFWLQEGMEALKEAPSGIVAGAIECTFRAAQPPGVWELLDGLTHLQQESYVRHEHYGATANLLVRKALFDAVGPFDENLFSGGDREWGRRAWNLGLAVVYAPRAVIWHPARRKFIDLAKKIRRVRGGEWAMGAARTGFLALTRDAWAGGRWRFRAVRHNKERFRKGGAYLAYLGIVILQMIGWAEALRLRAGGRPIR
jgi:GT2 family glycosyltransferase